MGNYDKYQAAVINGIKEHVAIMTSVQGLYRELKAGQTREDLVKSAVAGGGCHGVDCNGGGGGGGGGGVGVGGTEP